MTLQLLSEESSRELRAFFNSFFKNLFLFSADISSPLSSKHSFANPVLILRSSFARSLGDFKVKELDFSLISYRSRRSSQLGHSLSDDPLSTVSAWTLISANVREGFSRSLNVFKTSPLIPSSTKSSTWVWEALEDGFDLSGVLGNCL